MADEESREAPLCGRLAAKRDERDELLAWLETLEGEDASPEAMIVVQTQLDRVLREIRRLEGVDA